MKNIKLILLLCIALPLSSFKTDEPAKLNFEKGELSSFLEKSKKENKILFIDAYATWCGPCKKMDKTTMTDPELVAHFNNNFVNLKADIESTYGKKVQQEYNVRYLPTLLFISPDGKVLSKGVGYQNKQQLMSLAKEAMAKLN
ncbi:thioredoxin fold domain-containing protein [bacterium]|nr:thioredoxin fold domain-containing protein [bacterium]